MSNNKKKKNTSGSGVNSKSLKSSKKNKIIAANCHITVGNDGNNVFVCFTDLSNGEVFAISSGGRFHKGNKKRTPSCGRDTASAAVKDALAMGVQNIVTIFVRGIGPQRELAIKEIVSQFNLKSVTIIDLTSTAFNGCRPPKRRKV